MVKHDIAPLRLKYGSVSKNSVLEQGHVKVERTHPLNAGSARILFKVIV